MPKISVITPCYNAERYIDATIHSVRQQTTGDWELIVVDDGSTDGSLTAIEKAAVDDPRVRALPKPNGGVATARNAGWRASSADSEYLVFLDADDLLDPDFLTTLSSHLDRHPEVGLAYGSKLLIDERGELLDDQPGHAPRHTRRGRSIVEIDPDDPSTPLDALVSGFMAIPSTCMFRRSVYERTAGWRVRGVVEDKDMGMQMALLAPVHFVAEFLTMYRIHETQRHLDGFYRSMHELHERWWTAIDLDDDDLAAARAAIVVDRRVAARDARLEATTRLRNGELRAGAVAVKRSLAHTTRSATLLGRLALGRLRGTRPRG